MKDIHALDRRDLLIWGADLNDPAFREAYSEERTRWEAGGKKVGSMDSVLLYLLVRDFQAKPKSAKAKKELVA